MFEQDLKRGDTVVCTNDKIKPEALKDTLLMYPNWIREGETYTVRGFYYNDGIVTGVLLEEIKNPRIYIELIKREQEPAFALWRIKKIADAKEEEQLSEYAHAYKEHWQEYKIPV